MLCLSTFVDFHLVNSQNPNKHPPHNTTDSIKLLLHPNFPPKHLSKNPSLSKPSHYLLVKLHHKSRTQTPTTTPATTKTQPFDPPSPTTPEPIFPILFTFKNTPVYSTPTFHLLTPSQTPIRIQSLSDLSYSILDTQYALGKISNTLLLLQFIR